MGDHISGPLAPKFPAPMPGETGCRGCTYEWGEAPPGQHLPSDARECRACSRNPKRVQGPFEPRDNYLELDRVIRAVDNLDNLEP